MAIEKPNKIDDLLPPIERIGEPLWDDKIRELLKSFDVPLPECCSPDEVADAESRLGIELPAELKEFLFKIGPVSLDYIEILPPSQIVKASEFWFIEGEGVDNYIAVASAGGGDSFFVLDLESGRCSVAKHDPHGIKDCLAGFSELLRIACVDLYTGYYGWNDDDVQELRDELMGKLFNYVL